MRRTRWKRRERPRKIECSIIKSSICTWVRNADHLPSSLAKLSDRRHQSPLLMFHVISIRLVINQNPFPSADTACMVLCQAAVFPLLRHDDFTLEEPCRYMSAHQFPPLIAQLVSHLPGWRCHLWINHFSPVNVCNIASPWIKTNLEVCPSCHNVAPAARLFSLACL